jgi:hypothetical protein
MIGSIVYATDQGLGIMARDFYYHKIVNKVLIVPHSTHATQYEWYGKEGKNWKLFGKDNYEWFFKDLEKIIFFETPFDWRLIPLARERGIKTILQPNECTRSFLYEPDIVLCPSQLEAEIFRHKKAVSIPVPVDVKWQLRQNAVTFLHNAGHGGLGGRNGTMELIEAFKWVKSPVKLIIRTQTNKYKSDDPRIEIRYGTVPYKELFTEGDVFVFPDKFAGLSLPMQEAFASGMLVMTTDRFPNNTWLPKEPLIKIEGYKKEKIGYEIDVAVVNPRDIAEKIDAWYNLDITRFSLLGKEWGEKNSWHNLKDKYLNI